MEKKTNSTGCVDAISTTIEELKKYPDYKGEDKEQWVAAAQFLYDYLRELSCDDYEKIIKELNLVDCRSQIKLDPSAVTMGIVLKTMKKI